MSDADAYLLIVEDSAVLLNILLDWVRDTFPGKPVLGVTTVAAAHEAVAALKIDFFLVDYRLPDGSGLDFITDVRTVWPEARFAVMTLEMPEHELAALMTLKPVGFFRKPVEFDQLEWVLRIFLGPNQGDGTTNGSGGFRTTLHAATVLDLIQLNCLESATGAMEFRNATAELGRVYFSQGEIVHAETEAAMGIEALSEIIGWKTGVAQQLRSWAPPETITIGPPWQSALMEAAQLADESRLDSPS